ncbi:molybdenum cofactor guanylyltransferase [Dongshaea marina]|uniref:molybdenum cofactor guanylyltransferase n=1 Tax=Dongshaea marina TaxID=2047966 RepID=UPI00131EEE1C|nr:molybdenum cofactor guanylyltransferase [Dongshaea marina]
MFPEAVTRIDGVILAGGKSSRMGQDKASLLLDGRSLLQQLHEQLQSHCERLYVSGDYAGFDSIPDRMTEQGPLGGIASVLEQLEDDRWLLFWPVDVPFEGAVVKMFTRYLGQQISWDLLRLNRSPLPLMVHNCERVREALRLYLESGQRRVRGWAEQLSCHTLVLPQELENINTPDDWQRYRMKQRS